MNKIKLFLLLMMISLFSTLTVFAQTYVTSSDVLTSVKSGVIGISNLKPDRTIFSTGSAVVIDNINGDYYALTSYHIVHDQTYLEVVFEDKTTATASLVKTDFKQDLAMITFKTNKDLHQFTIKDYDYIKLGEPVYAIGNPLGYDYYGTVTSGIISNLFRQIDVDLTRDSVPDSTVNVLQHDASITSGNSGGALIDVNGNLIGINSFVKNNANDINFAIPSNTIIDFINISIPLNSISTLSDISDGADGAVGGVGDGYTPPAINEKSVCDYNGDGLITSDDYGQVGPPKNGSLCQTITDDYYPDEHVNDNDIIIITDYMDIPYIDHGTGTIEAASDDKYDVKLYGNGVNYLIQNIGLPLVYDHSNTYSLSYRVEDVDNAKRIYLSFLKVNDNTTIEYELTTKQYLANNVISIDTSKLILIPAEYNQSNSLSHEYIFFFNIDVPPIDEIYKIDIEYNTYEKRMFYWKKNVTSHTETIHKKSYEEFYEYSKFTNWLNNLIGNGNNYTIQESRNDEYDWEFVMEPMDNDLFVEQLGVLHLYYITDGIYHDAPVDHEPVDPPGTPDGTEEDLVKFFKNLKSDITAFKDWVIANQKVLTFSIVTIILIVLAVVSYTVSLIVLKPIIIFFKLLFGSLKLILSTLKLPLLLFKGKSNQVKYNQIKYKEFRR